MTIEQQIANLAWGLIGVVALALVIRYRITPTLLAAFRADLFRLRRDLFDFAIDHPDFKRGPAFTVLESQLNTLLARAEELTGLRIVVTAIMFSQKPLRLVEQIIDAHPHPVARATFAGIYQQTAAAVSTHLARMFMVSPALWVTITILVCRRLALRLYAKDSHVPSPSRVFQRNGMVASILAEATARLRFAEG
jgi:uncharacterized membrane protein